MPKVLIVGASGLVGTAAANSFINAGWEVVATSRRAPQFIEGNYQHLPLDLTDTQACANALSTIKDISHVVYSAVFELPGLVAGWSDPLQIETNTQMIKNLVQPLLSDGQLQHFTLLQGTKAYGGSVQPMRVPAREDQERVEHPNFYWPQEDFTQESAAQHGFNYTILRPQLIVGPNYGVVMNLPPIIGAYAALCEHTNQPFAFPGGADWVWEAADARLVGDACLWAAQNHEHGAHNETFNLTNGEVFMWRDMWDAIANTLGVVAAPDTPVSMAEFFADKETLWQEVVQAHNLKPIELSALLGESHFYADLCFAYGAQQPPPPTFVSTVKIKQAGFTQTYNTEESFCHWLEYLQQQKIIPRGGS